ncbi:Putative small intestine sodium-dependent phosphate transport protein [Tupaia chinensis]|uniref:Putative small intestine sodium-dependent phosphate transport protein n=1 Tax=Tupaia chinensis TaxID=246437 RepID=L8YAL7_TUPCH|nr:Putative small intestine sodium-dependent phosphate transport protein [Tupaia chinensis]
MSTGTAVHGQGGNIAQDGNLDLALEGSPRKGFCAVRYWLAGLLCLCNCVIFTQDMSLSIAIPAMVNHTASPSGPNASAGSQDPPWDPVYDWGPDVQGVILSSSSYASFLAPIPAGYVAGVFGTKYVVGAGLVISSVLSLLIPWASDAGEAFLIVLRLFQGVAKVMVFTGQFAAWVRWAPPLERTQLTAIAQSALVKEQGLERSGLERSSCPPLCSTAQSGLPAGADPRAPGRVLAVSTGSPLGCFLIFFFGGLVCQTFGWPYVFYIFGGIGCACCLLWFPLFADDPMSHPFIDAHEKNYIACSLAQQDGPPGWSLPIKAMTKSLPLWAVTISFFCDSWNLQIMMAYLPTYISSVLQASLQDSGMLSALPCVAASVFVVLGGLLADWLLSRNILRLITIRKLFTLVGVLLSSAFLVSLPWAQFSQSLTVSLLVLHSVFSSLYQVGAGINFLDIAPRYSSFLRGLLQMFAQLSGAISPTVAGFFISQTFPALLWYPGTGIGPERGCSPE